MICMNAKNKEPIILSAPCLSCPKTSLMATELIPCSLSPSPAMEQRGVVLNHTLVQDRKWEMKDRSEDGTCVVNAQDISSL